MCEAFTETGNMQSIFRTWMPVPQETEHFAKWTRPKKKTICGKRNKRKCHMPIILIVKFVTERLFYTCIGEIELFLHLYGVYMHRNVFSEFIELVLILYWFFFPQIFSRGSVNEWMEKTWFDSMQLNGIEKECAFKLFRMNDQSIQNVAEMKSNGSF